MALDRRRWTAILTNFHSDGSGNRGGKFVRTINVLEGVLTTLFTGLKQQLVVLRLDVQLVRKQELLCI